MGEREWMNTTYNTTHFDTFLNDHVIAFNFMYVRVLSSLSGQAFRHYLHYVFRNNPFDILLKLYTGYLIAIFTYLLLLCD